MQTLPEFDSVAAWLAAHDEIKNQYPSIAYRVTQLPDGGFTDGGECGIIRRSTSSVTVYHEHPDMPTTFCLDPQATRCALSAPRELGGRSYLFHSYEAMGEFMAREQVMYLIRKNFEFYASRANSLQLQGAMACVQGFVPEQELQRVLQISNDNALAAFQAEQKEERT